MLAAAEADVYRKVQYRLRAQRRKRMVKDYKPRVVFPFVEAGMGHIMPQRSLVEAFERK